jgi:RNA polymerase sigma-70 factor (ECF subfamily)
METDLSLLDAARKLDQNALVVIFDRYATELYNYALRIWEDPLKADSAVGDVFTKFLEQLAAGKDPQPHTGLRSYLYKIAYQFIVNEPQFSRHEVTLSLVDFEPDNGNGYHSATSDSNDKRLADKAITAIKQHLTADQRHVIVLHFLEGFSLPETAEIVGKRVNNVRAIQNRAIAKLCKVLDHKVSI